MPQITNIDQFSTRLRKDLWDHFDMVMTGKRLLQRMEWEEVSK